MPIRIEWYQTLILAIVYLFQMSFLFMFVCFKYCDDLVGYYPLCVISDVQMHKENNLLHILFAWLHIIYSILIVFLSFLPFSISLFCYGKLIWDIDTDCSGKETQKYQRRKERSVLEKNDHHGSEIQNWINWNSCLMMLPHYS